MKHLNFDNWIDYLISNKQNLQQVAWAEIYNLTESEYETIFKSVRIFQKGESSEAKHIFKKAEEFLSDTGDKSYYNALTLFINEEHRHSFELKRFMQLHDIPCLKKHWTDSAFRKLRWFGKLEQAITVLLTAEIIATVYYKALQQSTDSIVLKQICSQILSDEEMHIRFQSETLAQFYLKRNPVTNFMIHSLRRILLEGTFIVVWNDHKKVFGAAEYSFLKFRHECIKEFYKTVDIIYARAMQEKFDFINVQLQPFPAIRQFNNDAINHLSI